MYDKNNDGKVSFDEFRSIVRISLEKHANELYI